MKIFYVGGTSGKKFEAASYERILAEDTAIWWRSDPGARVGPDTAEVEQVNNLKGTRQWAVPRPKKKGEKLLTSCIRTTLASWEKVEPQRNTLRIRAAY